MKDKVIAFIIGIILGAVVTSGIFLIYNKTHSVDTSTPRQFDHSNERRNGNSIDDYGNGTKQYNGNGTKKSTTNSTSTTTEESM